MKRHNDAGHIIHKLPVLGDLGFRAGMKPVDEIITLLQRHRSPEGLYMSNVLISKAFGGDGLPGVNWMLCDSPTVLYSLLRFGVRGEEVEQAASRVAALSDVNGWRCRSAFPKFHGPGRKSDHCPYANLISLKALSMLPEYHDSEAVKGGVEAQLRHWEEQGGRKIMMFGIGTTFKRLKYPCIWYDVLHVLETLSRLQVAREDKRFHEMLEHVLSKQMPSGGFKPESIWMPWKGWSWGQKKEPCLWMTYKVAEIASRV